jgi:hypothetical protein
MLADHGAGGGGQAQLSRDRWTPLFNGRDLTGWEAEGNASWTVQDGMLVGMQGENNAPGDLFTTDSYSDFVLLVTYRVEWPANTGIWFRYQNANKAYQADILEYKNPVAYSGTLYCRATVPTINPTWPRESGWMGSHENSARAITLNLVNDRLVGDGTIRPRSGVIGFQVLRRSVRTLEDRGRETPDLRLPD